MRTSLGANPRRQGGSDNQLRPCSNLIFLRTRTVRTCLPGQRRVRKDFQCAREWDRTVFLVDNYVDKLSDTLQVVSVRVWFT